MKHKNLLPSIFCLLVLVVLACNKNKNPYTNDLGINPALAAQIDSAHYTLIKWKDSVINFGTIKEGDSVKLQYEFLNTGKTALFILEARPACGCTVTGFPKEPVMPGKHGFITAVFKSMYHPGNTLKTIRVTTNTRNKTNHVLIFKGMVDAIKKT